jgi:hypothetical protein
VLKICCCTIVSVTVWGVEDESSPVEDEPSPVEGAVGELLQAVRKNVITTIALVRIETPSVFWALGNRYVRGLGEARWALLNSASGCVSNDANCMPWKRRIYMHRSVVIAGTHRYSHAWPGARSRDEIQELVTNFNRLDMPCLVEAGGLENEDAGVTEMFRSLSSFVTSVECCHSAEAARRGSSSGLASPSKTGKSCGGTREAG